MTTFLGARPAFGANSEELKNPSTVASQSQGIDLGMKHFLNRMLRRTPLQVARKEHITLIPIQGGSGNVPTGALQFEDDWPGLWLRGDAAVEIFFELIDLDRELRDKIGGRLPPSLLRMADIIRQYVIVRSALSVTFRQELEKQDLT